MSELTNAAYSRWLRAQRPPMELFLSASEEAQEALALLGDQYLVDTALAFADAIRNPHEFGARAGDEESTMAALRDLAIGALSKSAPARPRFSTAGAVENRPAPAAPDRSNIFGGSA